MNQSMHEITYSQVLLFTCEWMRLSYAALITVLSSLLLVSAFAFFVASRMSVNYIDYHISRKLRCRVCLPSNNRACPCVDVFSLLISCARDVKKVSSCATLLALSVLLSVCSCSLAHSVSPPLPTLHCHITACPYLACSRYHRCTVATCFHLSIYPSAH